MATHNTENRNAKECGGKKKVNAILYPLIDLEGSTLG
jgi:hypothetical protein